MYSILKKYFVFLLPVLFMVSCGTVAPNYNYSELAKASLKLGMDIDYDDNHKLYVEAARWIGTPYRYGGNTRAGVDCSGFVYSAYRNVYNMKLKRTADEQYRVNCSRLPKKYLQEGDLVFFKGSKRSRKASHVGIYLKDGKFIHASSRYGVIISRLSEAYYNRMWLSGGRVKR